MSEVKDFPGFLPLSVDYREQFASARKNSGGYLKEEGKSSDKVLTSRLIDRSIEQFISASYANQVQVLSTVYSVDEKGRYLQLDFTSFIYCISNF